MKSFIVSILMVAGLICTANAELYKWVDENGVKHFSNTPPSDADEVESAIETKNESSDFESSGKIDEALKNYRQDNMQQRLNDAENYKSRTPNTNKSLGDDYEYYIKRKEGRVRLLRENLRDLRRERHRDPDSHQKMVKHHERLIKQTEIELENIKKKYYNNR